MKLITIFSILIFHFSFGQQKKDLKRELTEIFKTKYIWRCCNKNKPFSETDTLYVTNGKNNCCKQTIWQFFKINNFFQFIDMDTCTDDSEGITVAKEKDQRTLLLKGNKSKVFLELYFKEALMEKYKLLKIENNDQYKITIVLVKIKKKTYR